MKMTLSASLLLAVCILPGRAAASGPESPPLSLAGVIELASGTAPELRLALTRIAEGEAKLDGARVIMQENPRLELAAGPRSGDKTSIDMEVALEVPIELGKRRDKRVALAEADLRRDRHAVEDARRQAIAAAVGAYYRVLQAQERLALAAERKALADELVRVARDRHASGDVAQFEVNLALTEAARAESWVFSAKGQVASALGGLARALGLPSSSGVRVAGSIKDRTFFSAIRATAAPESRADLLAARADLEASRAAISLAEAERLPEVAFRAGVKREGDENVALGGISVTLPFFNPGGAQVQEARVRQQRAQLVAEIAGASVAVEVEGAQNAYAAAVEAVRRMEADGLSLQLENESLAKESYRAGKIGLSTLLQLRREALETRQEYLERLLEAAEAGVELASATGTWSDAK